MSTHSDEVTKLKETIKSLEKQNDILRKIYRQSQQKPIKPITESVDQLTLFDVEVNEDLDIS